jgi:hypothetical protein
MRFILNLLWAIFGGGLVLALEYAVVGLVCCLTIVGIPFGLQCFKLAGLALFPFGKDYDDGAQRGTGNVLLNIVWFIFAGVWIALTHLTAAIPLAGVDHRDPLRAAAREVRAAGDLAFRRAGARDLSGRAGCCIASRCASSTHGRSPSRSSLSASGMTTHLPVVRPRPIGSKLSAPSSARACSSRASSGNLRQMRPCQTSA